MTDSVYLITVTVDIPVIAESPDAAETWVQTNVGEWDNDLECADYIASELSNASGWEGVYPWNNPGEKTVEDWISEENKE